MNRPCLRVWKLPSISVHAIEYGENPVACGRDIARDHTRRPARSEPFTSLDLPTPDAILLYFGEVICGEHQTGEAVEGYAQVIAINFHFSFDYSFLINPGSPKLGPVQKA
jgi:hypothetical protein